jgi:hypothetical protein
MEFSMWHTEHTLETTAEPQRVWERVAAVATWPEWNQELTSAELTGAFAIGAQGRCRDQGVRSFRIEALESGRSCIVHTRLVFTDLRWSHRQEVCALGTRITQRIELSGPLAWLYGWLRGRRLRAGLAPSVRCLARLAAG